MTYSRSRIKCFILSLLLVLGVSSVFTAHGLKVGFIEGVGDGNDSGIAWNSAGQHEALEGAGIEYETIEAGDYKLDRLLQFDVIGVGVVAYDQNEDLKANVEVVKEYIEKGGYLVTLDYQQDSTWDSNFLPHPLTLLDDDLGEDNAMTIDWIVVADHPIWKNPNEITEEHFMGWGRQKFMADSPQNIEAPWEPLLNLKNQFINFVIIAGAESGNGYVVFNSLQILQNLATSDNENIVEVLENLLFWRAGSAVAQANKLTTTWGNIKVGRDTVPTKYRKELIE